LHALEEFQANCGVVPDGVCGAETVRTITRVISQTGTGPGIAVVRELEHLRHQRPPLSDTRIVVGQFGALSGLTRGVGRLLRARGAHVMLLDEPDAVTQARAANQFDADVYLGFEAQPEPAATIYFYRVPTFESVGGRSLAEWLSQQVRDLDGFEPSTSGQRLAVLRETRMPAVLCRLGPVPDVTTATPALVMAVVEAVTLWNAAPLSATP
jgi:N-acetylmuramoyl-L-alanine amidase